MRPKLSNESVVTGQRVTKEQLAFARNQREKMSPVERVLWDRLRRKQTAGFRFRRQQVVGSYVADFYCHSRRLAIEIDGPTHENPAADAARDRAFGARGIRVLRFTNQEVLRQLDGVIELIVQALETSP